ncbi:hypothetical protein Pelo_2031 [Pelomyxa schiedti]|nr:hypothetical protein Pelo_2031 [Pelomyxa schiedti]
MVVLPPRTGTPPIVETPSNPAFMVVATAGLSPRSFVANLQSIPDREVHAPNMENRVLPLREIQGFADQSLSRAPVLASPTLPQTTVPSGTGYTAAIPATVTNTAPQSLLVPGAVSSRDQAFITALRDSLSSRSDVSFEAVIGSVFFGPVLRIRTKDGPLALKVFGGDRMTYAEDCIVQLNNLKAEKDPHLTNIVEVGVTAKKDIVVATEFAPHGNLCEKMVCPEFQVLERIKALVGIAEAALVLHTRFSSPHGNIKPTNVLFSASDTVLLSDYFLEKLKASCTKTYWSVTPRQYGDPETIISGTPTPKSDVYALGILATELLTGRTAPDIPTPSVLKETMLSGSKTDITALLDKRCVWPEVVWSALVRLIRRCRVFDSHKRLEMAQVHKELLELQNALQRPDPELSMKDGCPICLQRPPEFAAIPCGHTFCAPCTKQVQSNTKQCGVCRQAVTNYQKVYFS